MMEGGNWLIGVCWTMAGKVEQCGRFQDYEISTFDGNVIVLH